MIAFIYLLLFIPMSSFILIQKNFQKSIELFRTVCGRATFLNKRSEAAKMHYVEWFVTSDFNALSIFVSECYFYVLLFENIWKSIQTSIWFLTLVEQH